MPASCSRSISRPTIRKQVVENINPANPTATYAALAAAFYNLPIAIYQYLVDTIQYQPYQGAMKGPLAVLQTGAGNDWDTDALLASIYQVIPGITNINYYSGTFASQFNRQKTTSRRPIRRRPTISSRTPGKPPPGSPIKWPVGPAIRPCLAARPGRHGRRRARSFVEVPGFSGRNSGLPGFALGGALRFQRLLVELCRTETAAEYYSGQVESYLATHDPNLAYIADVPYESPIYPAGLLDLSDGIPYTVVATVAQSRDHPGKRADINWKSSWPAVGAPLMIGVVTVSDVCLGRLTVSPNLLGGVATRN